MTPAPSSLRSRLINAALMLVAFGLLAYTLWSNRGPIGEVLSRRPDYGAFALGFAFYFVALLGTFVRWFVLVRAAGVPAFRLRDALHLGFIGNVFNLVIPGAVGGDVVKGAFLLKRLHAKKTQAVASMVIDRVIGLMGLFLLAGLTGLWAWSGAGREIRLLILFAWAALAAGAVGLAVVFTPALYRPVRRLVAGRGRLAFVVDELGEMAASYRARLGTVLAMLAMSTGLFVLYVLSFYWAGRAVFPELPGLVPHLIIVPLALFSTAVPLPFGALGLSEQVSGRLFAFVGHPSGAVAMIAYRLLMYLGGLVSLVVYLANLREVRELTVADDPDAAGEPSAALAAETGPA